jgi:hypothetical protein
LIADKDSRRTGDQLPRIVALFPAKGANVFALRHWRNYLYRLGDSVNVPNRSSEPRLVVNRATLVWVTDVSRIKVHVEVRNRVAVYFVVHLHRLE